MRIRTFRELDVWQKAMRLVDDTYRLTRTFPRDELFGLTSQARRSAVSMPANIAEGFNRHTTAAYVNHLSIALGSSGELQTLVEVASRQRFLARTDADMLQQQVAEVSRMLQALINSLERQSQPRPQS